MASPKSRITRSRRGMRRSHHRIKNIPLTKCSNCGAPTRPHCVCLSCGWYKKRQVITTQS